METSQQLDDSKANNDSENKSKTTRTKFSTNITSRSQSSPLSFAQSNEEEVYTHLLHKF